MRSKRRKRSKFIFISIVFLCLFIGSTFLGYTNRFKAISKYLDIIIFHQGNYINYFKLYFSKDRDINQSSIEEIFLTIGGNNLLNTNSKDIMDITSKDHITLMNLKDININNISYNTLKQNLIEQVNISTSVLKEEDLNNYKNNYDISLFNTSINSLINIKDKSIALLNYDINKNDIYSLSNLRNLIYSFKKDSTFVVITLDNFKDDKNYEDLSKFIIDCGCDLVVSNNPNSSTSITRYKNRFIIDGLYCNPNAFLYQFSLVFSEKHLVALGIKAIPFKTEGIPTLLNGTMKEDLLNSLNKNSKELDFNISDKFTFLELKP